MKPFLRWAGGKRWLTKEVSIALVKILNSSRGTYFEPFLGSGAMFFAIAPQKSILSDLNSRLIETYSSVRESSNKIQQLMQRWEVDKETYYCVRKLESSCRFERSARFIWLNRTCYGGLYRENKQGQFNVPYGGGSRTPASLFKERILDKANFILKRTTELLCSDFEGVMENANEGDVIYCDPTYSNVKRESFDRYGKHIFSWSDQVRLAKASKRAFEAGAVVVISNGFFTDLIQLYPQAYRIIKKRTKCLGKKINTKNNKEYLIILDPLKRRSLWEKIGKIERGIICGNLSKNKKPVIIVESQEETKVAVG